MSSDPSPSTGDPATRELFRRKLEAEQDFGGAAVAGAGVATLGAALWAVIRALLDFRADWMAVGVGILVSHAVRTFGKGIDRRFGVLGAALALAGCLAGDLLTAWILFGGESKIPFVEPFRKLTQARSARLLRETLDLSHVIFYVIAAWEGYRHSFRRLSDKEAVSSRG